jgi:hypothetical protein
MKSGPSRHSVHVVSGVGRAPNAIRPNPMPIFLVETWQIRQNGDIDFAGQQ